MFLEVYTDGASSPDGTGGWAWWASETLFNAGSAKDTTNQRMELTAALRAMQEIDQPIKIISDSAYLVNCFSQKWYSTWIDKNFHRGKKKQIKNLDLWTPILELYLEKPEFYVFEWVKGHSGCWGNDKADELAVAAKKAIQ